MTKYHWSKCILLDINNCEFVDCVVMSGLFSCHNTVERQSAV